MNDDSQRAFVRHLAQHKCILSPGTAADIWLALCQHVALLSVAPPPVLALPLTVLLAKVAFAADPIRQWPASALLVIALLAVSLSAWLAWRFRRNPAALPLRWVNWIGLRVPAHVHSLLARAPENGIVR